MPARRIIPIIALLVLSLSGCIFGGKKRAATPPPPKPPATAVKPPEEPLSIPQTRVQLPPAQPVDPRALETAEQPPAPPPSETVPAPKPQRRPAPIPTTGPQPETPPAPAAQQPAPEERPRLQEILSAEEKRRLAEGINGRKREVYEILQQASRRNLSQADRLIVERVRSFLAQSDQAAGRDDLRQADALSERAVVLARELRNAR